MEAALGAAVRRRADVVAAGGAAASRASAAGSGGSPDEREEWQWADGGEGGGGGLPLALRAGRGWWVELGRRIVVVVVFEDAVGELAAGFPSHDLDVVPAFLLPCYFDQVIDSL